MRLNVADLFCGTGGFSHGFTQTDQFDVLVGIDNKPAAIATFTANHHQAVGICQDMCTVAPQEVAQRLGIGARDLDVIIAGPPCQGFSSIRPYRSINEHDTRNSLGEQVIAYVAFFRPRFVVFENVVGLLHHQGARVLDDLQGAFTSLGYSIALQTLNAVNYGLPQKRERVILLARLGATVPRMPEPTHLYSGRSMARRYALQTLPIFSADLAPAVTVVDAIGDLPDIPAGGTATVYGDSDGAAYGHDYARSRRKALTDLTLHSATKHTPRMLEIIKHAGANRWALPEGLTTSGFSSCYSRLDADEPSTTLTVNFVHPASNRCIHPTQDRALTPREGARLQGFDDDFIFCGSRTQIVKQIGEAVPPLLGASIAQSILDQW